MPKKVVFQLVHPTHEQQECGETGAVLVPSSVAARNERRAAAHQGFRRQGRNDDDMMYLDDDHVSELESVAARSSAWDTASRATSKSRASTSKIPDDGLLFDVDSDEEPFHEADEVPFDSDFVHEIIYGEGGEKDAEDIRLRGSGDEASEDDAASERDDMEYVDEYPMHEPVRGVDRHFDRMMREFDVDMGANELDSKDPRFRGALEVEQYAPVLHEFADERAEPSYIDGEPVRHKGLLHQLHKMAIANRIFDSNTEGEFVVSLLPDRATRERRNFKEGLEEAREVTLRLFKEQEERRRAQRRQRRVERALKKGEALPTEGDDGEDTSDEEELDEALTKVVELPAKQQWDCETILTTVSTAYNHPNVIAAAPRPRKKNGTLPTANNTLDPLLSANVAHDKTESEDDLVSATDGSCAVINVSVRPKGESAEDKKDRRRLVKEMQRAKRQRKKEVKETYSSAQLSRKRQHGAIRQDRAQVELPFF